MRNLLRSSLFRLRKDIIFWLALVVCLVAGIVFAVSYLNTPAFDDVYFFPLFLALAAVLSLFLGREYSDGTLRNAVTAGHRRRGMYGAGLVTALLVSLLCLVAFWLPFLLVQGKALVRLGAGVVVPVAVGFLLLMAAMTALFTAVSFNVPNLAAGAIVNLILWVGLMLGAYQLEFALGQPEYVREVTMSAQGEMVEGPKMQNPNYLDGPLRVVYEGMEACLPQSTQRLCVLPEQLPVRAGGAGGGRLGGDRLSLPGAGLLPGRDGVHQRPGAGAVPAKRFEVTERRG